MRPANHAAPAALPPAAAEALTDERTATGTVSGSAKAWARRLAPGALVAIAAVVLLHTASGPARAFSEALSRAVNADARWVVAALAFEVLSFTGYIALLWLVAGRTAPRIGLRASYEVTLAGAAATRLLPTAGAGGAALTLWALRRAGHRDRAGVRTLLTFLVILYAVFLFAVLISGALISFGVAGGAGSLALSAVPAAGAGVAIAICGVLAFWPHALRRFGRIGDGAALFGESIRAAGALVRRADPRVLGALAWWGFDIAVLWSTFHAVGSPPPLAVLVLGYFVGQVANTIPVPGAASGGLVGVLLAFGGPAAVVLPSVLAYRAIAIWTPAPAGAAAMASLRRRTARWAREDEQLAPAEPEALAAARPSAWRAAREPLAVRAVAA